MMHTRHRVSNLLYLLRGGHLREIVRKLRFRLASETISIGLKRDLDIPFDAPEAKVPIRVRPFASEDMPVFSRTGAPDEEPDELIGREQLVKSGIPKCYVGALEGGEIAYVQWLIGSRHNHEVQSYFNGTFPTLADNEALLESAYTFPRARGKGIMPAAMARIAQCGRGIGARFVITFVLHTNEASLKGCRRAGFTPYLVRRERWRLFFRTITFAPWSGDAPYPLKNTSAEPSAPSMAEQPALKIH